MAEKRRWWERLNRGLFPYFGPAQLGAGPGGEREAVSDADRAARPCPLCGQPMSTHTIERTPNSSTATRLHCPARTS